MEGITFGFPVRGATGRGPASAGSRGTLRMNGISERKRERERQRERERESDQTGGAAESGQSLFFTIALIF